jgi:hypothetical protein
MFERIPNSVYVAIRRARTRDPLASNPRCNCFTPAKAHVVGGLACGAFGRIAPDLNRISTQAFTGCSSPRNFLTGRNRGQTYAGDET